MGKITKQKTVINICNEPKTFAWGQKHKTEWNKVVFSNEAFFFSFGARKMKH